MTVLAAISTPRTVVAAELARRAVSDTWIPSVPTRRPVWCSGSAGVEPTIRYLRCHTCGRPGGTPVRGGADGRWPRALREWTLGGGYPGTVRWSGRCCTIGQ